MNIITELFSQFSLESIILLLIALGVALKFIIDLTSFFYNKLKGHFNKQTDKESKQNQILDLQKETQESIKNLSTQIKDMSNRVDDLENQNALIIERLQENTRSYIIDKHHEFCLQIGAIDDYNLSSLERRYLYYKAHGGNSYIDGLMDEIRELPLITAVQLKNINKEGE